MIEYIIDYYHFHTLYNYMYIYLYFCNYIYIYTSDEWYWMMNVTFVSTYMCTSTCKWSWWMMEYLHLLFYNSIPFPAGSQCDLSHLHGCDGPPRTSSGWAKKKGFSQPEGREVDGEIIYIYTHTYDLDIICCWLLFHTIGSFMIYYHYSSVWCFIWSNWISLYLWCFVLLHSMYIHVYHVIFFF